MRRLDSYDRQGSRIYPEDERAQQEPAICWSGRDMNNLAKKRSYPEYWF